MTWVRLIRACVESGMTVRETAGVVVAVRRGRWEARTNRELAAQARYLALLVRSR